MGLGEYFYIHTRVYHWWQGHDPMDGSELLNGLEHRDGFNIQLFDDESNFGKSGSWRRYHANFRGMLGRQLTAATADPENVRSGRADILAAEQAALESDHGRTPWNRPLVVALIPGGSTGNPGVRRLPDGTLALGGNLWRMST